MPRKLTRGKSWFIIRARKLSLFQFYWNILTKLRTLFIRWKILVWISKAFQWQLQILSQNIQKKKRGKEDKLDRYTEIFINFLFYLIFLPELQLISWMVHFSEIQRFSDFLENFPENLHIICRHFKFFRILCWIESAPHFHLQLVAHFHAGIANT